MLYDNFKRLLSLVLAVVMVFSMVPVSAHAEETETPSEEILEEILIEEEPDEPIQPEKTEEPSEEVTEPAEVTEAPSEPAEAPSEETDETGDEEESTDVIGDDVLVAADMMASVVMQYLGTTEISEAEIASNVAAMDEDTFFCALIDMEDTNFVLQDLLDFDALSNSEMEFLKNAALKYDQFWFALVDRAEAE